MDTCQWIGWVSRRIDEARRQLLQDAKFADAALDVGFHDPAHLTRHFRTHIGISRDHGRRRADGGRAAAYRRISLDRWGRGGRCFRAVFGASGRTARGLRRQQRYLGHRD
ncbi:MAG: AraC family transcriptional regulator [bacterium]|nr:AraC family transcriptional regulator [bacterium]MCP5032467.1 AraC family transcriptional regulator [Actinomycetes bacterium]